MVNSFNYYYYAAAATAIAGILHIVLSANGIGRGSLSSIFFFIAGIAQLFWALPMARRWERIWYYIGIGGTIVLIILYFVTRFPTPITEGRALRINSMGIVIEIFQFLYIGLTAYILTRQGSSTHNIQNIRVSLLNPFSHNLFFLAFLSTELVLGMNFLQEHFATRHGYQSNDDVGINL